MKASTLAAALLVVSFPALSQETKVPIKAKQYRVESTSEAIKVDGVLDEAAWKTAVPMEFDAETNPGDNIVPPARTVGYMTYDQKNLYVAFQAFDPKPAEIRAHLSDRDNAFSDDFVGVVLDTFNDNRRAFEFFVNPLGVQMDLIQDDTNRNEDSSWDAIWNSAGRITAEGYTVEMAIPFTSIRFPRTDAEQTWGVDMVRIYPRSARHRLGLQGQDRNRNCYLCQSSRVTGFRGITPGRDIELDPTITAQHTSTRRPFPAGELSSGGSDVDAGLTARWGITPNLTLNAAINPDFSQIEADVPQITINRRFAVFFDEKRPFFLEGLDLFDTPLNVAYTRNIADPRAGLRSTGQFGSTAYTLLMAEDEGGGGIILPGAQANEFAVADFKSYATIGRVRHDLGKGFIGAVLTSREISDGGHNRVIGPDFQWRPNNSDTFTAQFLLSDTQNPNRPDLHPSFTGDSETSHALSVAWSHQKRGYDWFVRGRDVGDEFRADLGFVTQTGYRDVQAGGGLRFYPEGMIRFWRPSVSVARQVDSDNNTLFESVSAGVEGVGVKNTNFFLGVNPRERVLFRGQVFEQSYVEYFLQFDPFRRIPRVTISGRFGESIDFGSRRVGDVNSISLGTTVRPHDRLDLRIDTSRETLDINGSRLYTALIERLRVQYSFSAKSLLRVIGSYVTNESGSAKGGSFLGSVLYSYKLNWQTVLFVGYGDNRALASGNDLEPTDRSVFFKVSYAYQR